MRKFGIFSATIILAIVGLLMGFWLHEKFETQAPQPQLVSGVVLPESRAIAPFHLQFSDGKPFTQDNLQGQWHILFFGFTNCPWLCPTTLATLNQVDIKLRAANQTVPQVIFISVDPERDTAEKITRYVHSFNPHFVGARGSSAELEALTKQMSVMYMKVKPSNGQGDYTIDHSGAILLVNPKGQLYAMFSAPHDIAKLVQDITTINAANK